MSTVVCHSPNAHQAGWVFIPGYLLMGCWHLTMHLQSGRELLMWLRKASGRAGINVAV